MPPSLWVQSRIHGKSVRQSLGTRSRQRPREIIKTLLDERPGTKRVELAPAPSISSAIADYLRYCEHNKRLKGSTLVSYRDTLEAFETFCSEQRFRTVDQLNLSVFEQFQASRSVTPKTMSKEFTHCPAYFPDGSN
ncbi:MAG TPA: site-specific integrase [Bryobacteraceae bacterium]|nr:site-specific integrase [Bryobacteraceae bacterium]